MHKKTLNEAGICDNYVTPAITGAGWDAHTQVRREYGFTAGRIIVRGKLAVRGERKRADYLLFYQPNLPLAVNAKGMERRLMVRSEESMPLWVRIAAP